MRDGAVVVGLFDVEAQGGAGRAEACYPNIRGANRIHFQFLSFLTSTNFQ